MRDAIHAYIRDEILGEDAPSDLADDTPLLSSGLMDSLAVEQLLLFLEDEYRVRFEDADYSVENFETVIAIEELLRRKQTPAAAGGSA
ncbi:MAG TPA: acyl carrier protein [Actinomycetota bacterium]|jgi:acyl carrier protein